MKDFVQNVTHDNKGFDDIILLEFVTCGYSNNIRKCEQLFMRNLVQNVKHVRKCFDDIILLEFVACQYSNNI